MRNLHLLPPALLLTLTHSFELPDLQPFISALSLPISIDDYIRPNDTSGDYEYELRKRQSNSCLKNWNNCGNLGASNLCCAPDNVCSADNAGMVACCPSTAACQGTINGIIQSGTVNSDGVLLTSGSAGQTNSVPTTSSFVFASATTTGNAGLITGGGNGGFVVDGSSTVATVGSGSNRAEVPLVARAILKALEYLPI